MCSRREGKSSCQSNKRLCQRERVAENDEFDVDEERSDFCCALVSGSCKMNNNVAPGSQDLAVPSHLGMESELSDLDTTIPPPPPPSIMSAPASGPSLTRRKPRNVNVKLFR
jgi:hypothetical protein